MQKIKLLLVVFLFTFCSVVFANKQFAAEVDKKFQNYKKVAGISGALNSIGSDTLNNLMTFWAEDFRQLYPSVQTQVEGKGSSTAPPALIEGKDYRAESKKKNNQKQFYFLHFDA